MPPKLVYYVRVWGRNARPTQDMGMSPQENTMNYATIKYCDIANGEGVRTSLFVSGCRRHCPNCFNAVAWDFGYGAPFTKEVRNEILESLAPGYINGLSLLGGELLVFGRQFLALFTTESAVIDAGMKRIMVMGWAYCTSAFMDCTIAASRGLGKTVGPTVIVILGSCVFRVAWVYTIFAHFHTIPALYLLYPCSWALTAAAEIVYFVFSYRHAALCLQERDALAQL